LPSVGSGLEAFSLFVAYHHNTTTEAHALNILKIVLGDGLPSVEDMVWGLKALRLESRVLTNVTASTLKRIPYPCLMEMIGGGFVGLGVGSTEGHVKVVNALLRTVSEVSFDEAVAMSSGNIVLTGHHTDDLYERIDQTTPTSYLSNVLHSDILLFKLTEPNASQDALLQEELNIIARTSGKEALRKACIEYVRRASADVRAPDQGMAVAALAKESGAETTARSEQSAPPARHPLAAALDTMTLEQRRTALDEHYAARKQNTWTQAKGTKPTPDTFLAWLDVTFPDRRDVGLVLSDLRHLDPPAYKKVDNWSRENSGVSKETITGFGLPTKTMKYDAERDANAPQSLAEVYARAERGEDSVKNLHRAYSRAAHHRP
jgi:hypothetical protein